jgi:hypothetical protein
VGRLGADYTTMKYKIKLNVQDAISNTGREEFNTLSFVNR